MCLGMMPGVVLVMVMAMGCVRLCAGDAACEAARPQSYQCVDQQGAEERGAAVLPDRVVVGHQGVQLGYVRGSHLPRRQHGEAAAGGDSGHRADGRP
jgi:hypothetical protein